jgi:hypothetical protein
MRAINCVLSVNITHAQKRVIVLLSHQLNLVHTCVWSEAYLPGLIVCVGCSAGDVVRGDTQIIEAIFDFN